MIDSIVKVFRGIAKLRGASDNTLIGNISDRLKVDAVVALPSDRFVAYESRLLLDVANSDMLVDGSGTPVPYSSGPAVGKLWFVENLKIFIRDDGAFKLDEFGSGPALTTGLLVEARMNGAIETSFTIKNNKDMFVGMDELIEVDQVQGSPLLIISVKFLNPLTLVGDQGDFIRITVQDDLTNLESLSSSIRKWEVV